MDASQVFDSFKIAHPDKIFIDGRWVSPAAGGMIDVISPNSEELVIRVAEGGEADMDRAVAAARRAFDEGPWTRMTHAERAVKMRELAAKVLSRASEFSFVHTEQMGALPGIANFGGMMAAGQLEYYASLADTFAWEEERKPQDGQGVSYVVREAVGVVAMIMPWNGPLMLLAQKVAPAMLAGCTVILKPAPETPLEAYIFTECAEAVGIPPGVINLVCAHREASDYLVRQHGVDKVSFTGSTAAGRRIASVCGERIARVSLELGGKSAAIVLDDIDPETVANTLAGSTCILSGQVCAALTRIVVSRKRHDQLVDALASSFAAIKIGYSRDAGTQLGPLAMKRQLERVEGYIAKGRAEGAQVATGGGRPKDLNRGYFIEPTVFSGVDNSFTIAREEIFGPVVSVIPYETEDDAIRIANDTIYGLNGAVFTNDPDRAYSVIRRVRTGTMVQNQFKLDTTMPFGGYKQSGIGREYGLEGLMPYLETKTVHMEKRPSKLQG